MKEYEVNICSMCGALSYVIDTRPCSMIPGTVRRRRKCSKCRNRWSTIEIPYDIARELLKEEAGTDGS